MKNIIIASLVTFSSIAAFAQPVSLLPGSSVVINGDLVSCQGPSPDAIAPACSIKQDGSYYRLYAGTVIAQTYYTFNEAVAGVKEMKAAGLCR